MNEKLILASGSPRRRELLRKLGRPFTVIVPHADESFNPRMPPDAIAVMLAQRKAQSVAKGLSEGIVIGADTLVALGSEIIGKPRDRAEAVEILSRLSGARQAVITGVCLVDAATGRSVTGSETTWVTMRKMSREQIQAYVGSGEADGKAGAYAIQETGDRYVEKLEGDFDNVVGLPVGLVRRLLAEMEKKRG